MKEKKCGCIVFEHGPPIPCERHARKIEKQEARVKAKEEKGLRKIVAQQALDNGHDLARFKEYSSQQGKWTSHCHQCGALIIVYDEIPERGDQISGRAVFEPCNKSDLVGTLGAAERDAVLARFAGKTGSDSASDEKREDSDEDTSSGTDDGDA